jgi:hypothetical protein
MIHSPPSVYPLKDQSNSFCWIVVIAVTSVVLYTSVPMIDRLKTRVENIELERREFGHHP